MCNHPYFAANISREEFRRRGIRPVRRPMIASVSLYKGKKIVITHHVNDVTILRQ